MTYSLIFHSFIVIFSKYFFFELLELPQARRLELRFRPGITSSSVACVPLTGLLVDIGPLCCLLVL